MNFIKKLYNSKVYLYNIYEILTDSAPGEVLKPDTVTDKQTRNNSRAEAGNEITLFIKTHIKILRSCYLHRIH